ncbi:hypothetical protein QEN19_003934 [Hanseniaspora menglaensis]
MRGYKFSPFDYSVIAITLLVSIYNSQEFFGPMIQEQIDTQTNIDAGKVDTASVLHENMNNIRLSSEEKQSKIAEQVRDLKESLNSSANKD